MFAFDYLKDLVSLFYPRICPGCGLPLQRSENHICIYCLLKLPKTGFELRKDNPVEKVFKGRIPVQQAHSFMYFRKKGLAQRLMHELKYNGNRDLGKHLGALFAEEIFTDLKICMPDLVTTVPLHAQKMIKRGFNQSDEIAKGFSEILGIPFVPLILRKSKNTDTQTRKKRFERWENTEGSFELADSQMIEGKHVAILDDVITTGATLEACGQQLLRAPDTRISIFSLCFAIH
jgi:ComF family protein